MNTNTKAFHRHVVAVPLMLSLCLGIVGTTATSVASAILPGTSDQSITAPEKDTDFTLADGTVGRVAAQGSLAVEEGKPSLVNGGVLIASRGILWLKTGDAALLGFGGGMYVNRNQNSLTVSALSTPVLLRNNGFIAFIPQGRQAVFDLASLPQTSDHVPTLSQLDTLSGIDSDFYRKELGAVTELQGSGSTVTSSVTSRALSAGTGLLDLLRLPATADRLNTEDLSRTIDRLRMVIKAGDAPALHALLSDSDVQYYLQTSPQTAEALPGLLGTAAEHTGMVLELLPFVTDPDLQLLAALHPQLRAAAWINGTHAGSDDRDAVRLSILLFPLSDILSDPAPELVTRHWSDALASEIASSQDQQSIVGELFSVLPRYVTLVNRLGYPDRLHRLLAETARALDANPSAVTDDQRSQLQMWNSSTGPSLAEVAMPEGVDTSDQTGPSGTGASLQEILDAFGAGSDKPVFAPLTSAEAEEAVQAVKETLKSAGALFTVRTSIEALSKDHVAVTNVVFSSNGSDHFYTFEFQPSTGAMSALTRDGDKMLFGMTLQKFTEWIQGK